LQSYSRDIMREIGKALNDVRTPSAFPVIPTQSRIRGEKGYSNWELSADRANAARRELIGGGLVEARFRRVVGLSSPCCLTQPNPLNPSTGDQHPRHEQENRGGGEQGRRHDRVRRDETDAKGTDAKTG